MSGLDVPPDRAKALQTAFADTFKDPQFLADAEKLHVDISPVGRRRPCGCRSRCASAGRSQGRDSRAAIERAIIGIGTVRKRPSVRTRKIGTADLVVSEIRLWLRRQCGLDGAW